MSAPLTVSTRESSPFPEGGAPDEGSGIQRQQALVVGIGDYGGRFATLGNARNDARAVAELLAADYGFELLPNGGALLDAQAGLETIQEVIRTRLDQADAATRWLFYFAGHGTVVDGRGYLIPSDAGYNDPGTYLALDWLLAECQTSACGEVLILLDACHSGQALVRSDSLDLPAPSKDERRVRQILTSGSPDEPVLDGGAEGHSIFTQTLLETLRGWTGAHDEQGRVTFPRLHDELAYQIPVRLRTLGFSSFRQQPLGGNFLGNSVGRQFSFTPRAGLERLPPEIVRDLRSGDSERRVSGWRLVPGKTQDRSRSQAVAMAVWALQKDSSASVRQAAAVALGGLHDLGAGPALIGALLDESEEVRRAAAHALGQLGVKEAAPALLERLRAEGDALFLDLIDAIGVLEDPDAILVALAEALRRKKLVPVMGPDFTKEQTNLPGRAEVVLDLLKRVDDPEQRKALVARPSLAEVADSLSHGGRFLGDVILFLRTRLDDPRIRPGPVYNQCAKLPVSLWISTAYDTMLERAVKADARVVSGESAYSARPERTTVVKLLGDITQPDSLVLLEQDYKVLRPDETDRHALLDFLRRSLAGKVVVVLGSDPASPDFELLVKYVFNEHLQGTPFSLVLVSNVAPPVSQLGERRIHWIESETLSLLDRLSSILPTQFPE